MPGFFMGVAGVARSGFGADTPTPNTPIFLFVFNVLYQGCIRVYPFIKKWGKNRVGGYKPGAYMEIRNTWHTQTTKKRRFPI